jgi:uncharacterized protein (TIGR02266 family)
MDGSEKRSGPRILSDQLRCWCRVGDRGFYVRSKDLSVNGVALRTLADLPPGTRLELEIEFAGKPPVAVEGEVVWRRGVGDGMGAPGVGVRFLKATEAGVLLPWGFGEAEASALEPKAQTGR